MTQRKKELVLYIQIASFFPVDLTFKNQDREKSDLSGHRR